jgi:hypothetical protein
MSSASSLAPAHSSSQKNVVAGVKCEIAAVAEELPPRNSPFADLRRNRRFRFY